MDIFVKPSVGYVKYLKVLMISVYENNKDVIDEEGITFWCLHNALEETHKKEIQDIADRYNQKVEFIFVDVHIFDKLPSSKSWPRNVYFDLLAHQFLPESVHRVLHLDIDVAVNGSIKEFYNLPFDGNFLIASKDVYDARHEPINEFESFTYENVISENRLLQGVLFNPGAVLFNLDKFREEKIDIDFYNKKMFGKQLMFADQSVLNYCFYNKVKFLKTCKYNYRIAFSMADLDESRDNFYYNTYLHFKFCSIEPRIIHYCGYKGFKPWMVYFSKDEIDINLDFRDICKEYADYIAVWWKYAKLSPDFDELWATQRINKAAYYMIKILIRHRAGEFAKRMYLNSVNIPDYFGRALVRKGDDINRYVKPGVYACDASTKPSVKNLPISFTEQTNFRLTVKALSVGAAYSASLVQELEVADENASLYRRYTKNRDSSWSNWTKMANDKACQYSDMQFDKRINDVEIKLDKSINSSNEICNELERLKQEVKLIKDSQSYKIGRALTYIPRKIKIFFKKKND